MAIALPRRIPITTLAAGSPVWRVHRGGYDALWFGPGAGNPARNRFDAPGGQFGVCYFAASLGAGLPAFIPLQGAAADEVIRIFHAAGGLAYLSSLCDAVPSAANLTYYADIVREKQAARGAMVELPP